MGLRAVRRDNDLPALSRHCAGCTGLPAVGMDNDLAAANSEDQGFSHGTLAGHSSAKIQKKGVRLNTTETR